MDASGKPVAIQIKAGVRFVACTRVIFLVVIIILRLHKMFACGKAGLRKEKNFLFYCCKLSVSIKLFQKKKFKKIKFMAFGIIPPKAVAVLTSTFSGLA